MTNEITPQERADVSRRWRPLARLPGLHAALECAETEDAIVRELCNPDGSVSPSQVAAAVEIACRCAAVWANTTRWAREAGSRSAVYKLHADDFAWLSETRAK